MKKILLIISIILSASVAHAALIPTSVYRDTTGGYIRPIITNDYIQAPYVRTTSTSGTNVFNGFLNVGTTSNYLSSFGTTYSLFNVVGSLNDSVGLNLINTGTGTQSLSSICFGNASTTGLYDNVGLLRGNYPCFVHAGANLDLSAYGVTALQENDFAIYNHGDLLIGAASPDGVIRFFTGGDLTSVVNPVTINSSGNLTVGSDDSEGYELRVRGDVKFVNPDFTDAEISMNDGVLRIKSSDNSSLDFGATLDAFSNSKIQIDSEENVVIRSGVSGGFNGTPTFDQDITLFPGSGNVGIGTTSPYAKLSVVGQVVAEYFSATSTTATNLFNGFISSPKWDNTNFIYSNNGVLTGTSDVYYDGAFNIDSEAYINGETYFTGPVDFDRQLKQNFVSGSGWLHQGSGAFGQVTASTSPVVNWITATSTTVPSTFAGPINVTATAIQSTFAGGINVTGNCIADDGVCVYPTSIGGEDYIIPSGSGIFTAAEIDLTDNVQNTLPVANGGTGSTTLSGILKGNGTSAVGTVAIGSNLTFDGTTLSATGGSGGVGTSTNPFMATYFVATSTTATSTFGGDITFNNAYGTILPLSDTAANLASIVPLLGERVYETDTTYTKVGDGVTTVANLQPLGLWAVNGSNIYRSSGNVGIGTSSPYAKLSVVGPVVASHFVGTTTTTSTFGGTIQNSAITANASNQRLGVNNASPNYTLDVFGTSFFDIFTEEGNAFTVRDFSDELEFIEVDTDANYLNLLGDQGGQVNVGTQLGLSMLNVASGLSVGAYTNTAVAPTDGAIISGNVGIGTTSPYTKLAVVGTTTTSTLHATSSTGLNILEGKTYVGTTTSSELGSLVISSDANGRGLVVAGRNVNNGVQNNNLARFEDANGNPILRVGNTLSSGLGYTMSQSAGFGTGAFTGLNSEFFGGFDISYGGVPGTLVLGAENNLSTRTNNTAKVNRVVMPPYNSSHMTMALIISSTNSSTNNLGFGGGSSVVQGATQTDFFTAPTVNTPGISRMTINNQGLIGFNDTTPSHIIDVALPLSSTAKTAAFSTLQLTNTATSSTANIAKSGVSISSTGTWSGTNARNIGVHVTSVTGGTNNFDAIFDGGGNVGIGTSTPYAKLSVGGEVVANGFHATSTGYKASGLTGMTKTIELDLGPGGVCYIQFTGGIATDTDCPEI